MMKGKGFCSRRRFIGNVLVAGSVGTVAERLANAAMQKPVEQNTNGPSCMKALLFFDDWLLHRRDGLDRIWHQPTYVKDVFTDFFPGFLGYGGYLSVFRDEKVGRYVMYLAVYPPQADPGVFVVRLESDDPYNWPPPRFERQVTPAWKGFQNVVTDQRGERFWPMHIQSLAGTPLAERGYVAAEWYVTEAFRTYKRSLIQQRLVAAPRPSTGEGSVLGFSQDGLHFNVDREHPWHYPGSDVPGGTFLWSDKAGVYVIFTRRVDLDRRIAYSTTTDFEHFSPILTALQPDARDPIGTELYEMPVRPYEDMYLGFLHVLSSDPLEKDYLKWAGREETQLAHSYNGINWIRPVREPFMGVRDYGLQGGGMLMCMEMLRTPKDRLLFYTHSSYGEHAAYPVMQAAGRDMTGYVSPLLYELRLDGFCSLRTRSRDGVIETKTIIPQAGDIRLNVRTTKHTGVRVQLLDGLTLEPLPGYTFRDAVEISGDHLFAPVRWQAHDTISEWVGKPVRLEIQMREAELFAIRMEYKSYYTTAGTPPLESLT
ncbi:MAG: hypothetical protein AB1898_29995 [Acidobacteriota bacterium]